MRYFWRSFGKTDRQAIVNGGAERDAAIFPKFACVFSKAIGDAAIAAPRIRAEFPDVLITCCLTVFSRIPRSSHGGYANFSQLWRMFSKTKNNSFAARPLAGAVFLPVCLTAFPDLGFRDLGTSSNALAQGSKA